MNNRRRKKKIRKENKMLAERFPFLIPRNIWTDKIPKDYDYTYTLLDSMPCGWRRAFGRQLLEELREELVKWKYLDQYRVVQIKEKYGQLRWYDNGSPNGSDIENIISRYSVISENVCILCGKLDVPMVMGYWILPVCRNCYRGDKPYDEIADIEHSKIKESYVINIMSNGNMIPTTYDTSKSVAKIRPVKKARPK